MSYQDNTNRVHQDVMLGKQYPRKSLWVEFLLNAGMIIGFSAAIWMITQFICDVLT